MPEAIKETTPEAPQPALKEDTIEKLPCKEVHAEEASSGTLPADDNVPSQDVGEGAVAPDLGQVETPEEGKNIPVSKDAEKEVGAAVSIVEGNGTEHKNNSKEDNSNNCSLETAEASEAQTIETNDSGSTDTVTKSSTSENNRGCKLTKAEEQVNEQSLSEHKTGPQPKESIDLGDAHHVEKPHKDECISEEIKDSKPSVEFQPSQMETEEGTEKEKEVIENDNVEIEKEKKDVNECESKSNDKMDGAKVGKETEPLPTEESMEIETVPVESPGDLKKDESVGVDKTSESVVCPVKNDTYEVEGTDVSNSQTKTIDEDKKSETSQNIDKDGVLEHTKTKDINDTTALKTESVTLGRVEGKALTEEPKLEEETPQVAEEKAEMKKDSSNVNDKKYLSHNTSEITQDLGGNPTSAESNVKKGDSEVTLEENNKSNKSQVSDHNSTDNAIHKEGMTIDDSSIKDNEIVNDTDKSGEHVTLTKETNPKEEKSEQKSSKTDVVEEQKSSEVEKTAADASKSGVEGNASTDLKSEVLDKPLDNKKPENKIDNPTSSEPNTDENPTEPGANQEKIPEEKMDTNGSTHDDQATNEIKETSKETGSTEESKDITETMPKDKKLNGEKSTEVKEAISESMDHNESEAGSSRSVDPKTVEEVEVMFRDAKAQMATGDYFTAADLLGKACEVAGKLYGDLAKENVELYYLYGCAMLECAKNENPVLGEGVKEDESEAGDDTEVDAVDEKMEVEEEKMVVDKDDEPGDDKVEENGQEVEANGEESTNKESDEDEDSSLKVAWEMFELAKIIFSQIGNDLRLSDTYIKLGEVGMESGHQNAVEDMKNALEIRKKCAIENERLLAETHFNIGLAYATFQSFDEAIDAFKVSKSILQSRIDKLKKINDQDPEIKEINELFPDLDDKIADMEESKKAKLTEGDSSNTVTNGEKAPLDGAGSSKPVSNISHLVKRKRKLEEVATDLLPSSKQPCTEIVSEPESTNVKDSSN